MRHFRCSFKFKNLCNYSCTKDLKYTALLINEDLYINQHKTRIYEIATKTHTNVISKRFGFENFCCDFAKLEDKYKSYIPEFGIGSNS